MTKLSADSRQKIQASRQAHLSYLPVLFLVVAIFFLPTKADSGPLTSLAIVFVSIVLEAIPFMFVGALAGGIVEAFVSRDRMTSLLPQRGWVTVCLSAMMGIIFPVCECAVVPVVRRLVRKGLPLPAAIGYLLGGPIVNPIVAASTAFAYKFDWRVVTLRLVLGYGIAVTIGLLMGRIFSRETAIKGDIEETDGSLCGCGSTHESTEFFAQTTIHASSQAANQDTIPACACTAHAANTGSFIDKIGWAFRHAADDFLEVGHYLVIGAFIAALAQTYIERSFFLKLAGTPALSVVLMMVLAILLNLCSEADAFIASSFRGLMPLPAQMAFMLTGPMFDLKLLLMYQSVFRRKAIMILAALILIAVLGASTGLELISWVAP
jgi:uncharacterized membrane protein YraQ (UPF0718 family)